MRLGIFEANAFHARPFHRQTCWKSAATVKPGGNFKGLIGALYQYSSDSHDLIIRAGFCGLVPVGLRSSTCPHQNLS